MLGVLQGIAQLPWEQDNYIMRILLNNIFLQRFQTITHRSSSSSSSSAASSSTPKNSRQNQTRPQSLSSSSSTSSAASSFLLDQVKMERIAEALTKHRIGNKEKVDRLRRFLISKLFGEVYISLSLSLQEEMEMEKEKEKKRKKTGTQQQEGRSWIGWSCSLLKFLTLIFRKNEEVNSIGGLNWELSSLSFPLALLLSRLSQFGQYQTFGARGR
jgi:cobalamin biosynthesis Mg chelatase CobN